MIWQVGRYEMKATCTSRLDTRKPHKKTKLQPSCHVLERDVGAVHETNYLRKPFTVLVHSTAILASINSTPVKCVDVVSTAVEYTGTFQGHSKGVFIKPRV